MSEGVQAPSELDEDHQVLPFRLRDMEPFFSFNEVHPIAKPLDTFQVELRFQSKLAVREWGVEHWGTVGIGVLAFLLGSLSPEILSGGDATIVWDRGISGCRRIWVFPNAALFRCLGFVYHASLEIIPNHENTCNFFAVLLEHDRRGTDSVSQNPNQFPNRCKAWRNDGGYISHPCRDVLHLLFW